VSSILQTAITIHLRQIGDDSDDEDSNIQPSIKQEAIDFASIKLPSTLKSKQVTLSTKSEPRSANSSSTDTTSIIIQESDKLNHDTTSGSTTQEDTPPPSYLSAENSSTSHFLHPSTFRNSTNHEPERPSTPTTSITTRSTLARKRSITLLSPQKITTRSTRELKRKSSSRADESGMLSLSGSRTDSTTGSSQIGEKTLNNNSK